MISIHHQLAAARSACQAAKDSEKVQRAWAERRAVASLNGTLGKNAEERERQLTVALAEDSEYKAALARLRQAELRVAELEADLEAYKDQRRESEWAVRAALVNALAGRQIFAEADDTAFDAAGDEAIYQELTEDEDEGEDDGMSHGDPTSAFYAQQRRPQPTYAAGDDECPF